MKYAYFLGCITPNRYPSIEMATKKTLKAFDIDLIDIEGASCCPAPGVFGSFDLLTWIALAARNISLAEEMGLDMTFTCNGCYASIQEADHLLRNNANLRADVDKILNKINRQYKGSIKAKHVIEIITDDIGLDKIKEKVKFPLEGVKVAVHYGCHFLKPSDVRKHGTSEKPIILDEFVRALGAESVEYEDKLMCCGAGGGVRTADAEISLNFTKEKVENMIKSGADCVVTPCAFCHLQFDVGQIELKKSGIDYNLPVVFITQLLGLSLGMSEKDVGLNINKTQTKTLIEKIR